MTESIYLFIFFLPNSLIAENQANFFIARSFESTFILQFDKNCFLLFFRGNSINNSDHNNKTKVDNIQ